MENITLPSEQQVLAFVAAQEAALKSGFSASRNDAYFSVRSGYGKPPGFYGSVGIVCVNGKTVADVFAAIDSAIGPAAKRARAADLRAARLRAEAEKLEKEAAS